MARERKINVIDSPMDLTMQEGFADAFHPLLNEAMRIDRSRHLGAGVWERSEAPPSPHTSP